MFNNLLSIKINKPKWLTILSVMLIISGVITRSGLFFGIPKEGFYAIYFTIFIFIITTIQVKNLVLPKQLFLTFVLTCLLVLTGLIYFYFELDFHS